MKRIPTRIGPVKFRQKWGFLNEDGEFTISPVFEELGEYSEGLISFKKGGRIGFIDAFGRVKVPPRFEQKGWQMPVFCSGLAAVASQGMVGYVDVAGDWQILPSYQVGFDFVGGRALVDTGHEYLVITREGVKVSVLPIQEFEFRPKWPKDWNLLVGRIWREGVCFAVVVDLFGREIIPARFHQISDFWEGTAGYTDSPDEDAPFGLINSRGEVFRSPEFFKVKGFSDGLARARPSGNGFGFINTQGEWAIQPVYERACPFKEGLACVTVKGRQGFINTAGEMVIEPRFRGETAFHQGFAQVFDDNRAMVINNKGRIIWQTTVDQL